jgi:hypothetical protein
MLLQTVVFSLNQRFRHLTVTNICYQRDDDGIPQYSKESFHFETLKGFLSMNIPFHCADNQQLRKLFKMLRPTVDCPSSDKLRKDLAKEVCKVKEEIKVELKNANKVCLAMDAWTSPNKIAFLAIVVYWITPDWRYRHELIAFEQLHGTHTGKHLNRVLIENTKEYEIHDKVLAINTDNASNNDTMHQEFVSDVRKAIGKMKFDVFHIPCLAHVIQLSVKVFLDNIDIIAENDTLEKTITKEKIKKANKLDKGFKRTLTLVSIGNCVLIKNSPFG